jgi:hypothetical protein
MKTRNNKYQEWKSDNGNSVTGNTMKIKSEESILTGEIKITFHRPRPRQKNGSPVNLRKLLQLKHNTDFNNPKS